MIFIYVERYPSEDHTTKKNSGFYINLFYLFIYAHTLVCLCVCVYVPIDVQLPAKARESAISLGAEVSGFREPHDVGAALWLSPTLVGNY